MQARKRIRLFVQYDGTNYHGWQVQNNGITIEEKLNQALQELTGEDIRVIGASRTDSGVHALCNVAVYDTESPIPAQKVCYALNARLPEDIRITRSDEVPSDWHPRKCKSSKTYEYRIYTGEILPPTRRLYVHHVYRKLDLEAMREAAQYLVGEHDFKSFCQENAQVETTVRTIYGIKLEFVPELVPEVGADRCCASSKKAALDDPQGNANTGSKAGAQSGELRILVTGGGFLYNMVRIIVGTLLEVGFGRLCPEELKEILEKKDRSAAGPTAPAKGLTLVHMTFEDETE